MEIVGVRNRKTVSDLKLKKTLQDPIPQLLKITKTVKLTQAKPKLTPILGQITIIPIKPQNAQVRQMLQGKQAMKVVGPLKRFKFNTYNCGNVGNYGNGGNCEYYGNYGNYGNGGNWEIGGGKFGGGDLGVGKDEDKDGEIDRTQQTKQSSVTNKIQQQLLSPQKQPKKPVPRVKTLPKIENESKYLTERADKLERPLLSALDHKLKVRALHFYILCHEDKVPVIAYRSRTKIQVASLTKIMTFYTVYRICGQFGIDLGRDQVEIQEDMVDITGTTASLAQGQIYTIQQLLYGMMLPSGNDASLALAIHCGRILSKHSQPQPPQPSQSSQSPQPLPPSSTQSQKFFIQRMNLQVKQLKMTESSFGNPHGLPHRNNRTTCEDVAKLCSACLEIPLFREVVATKVYKFKVYDAAHKRKVAFHWENTNKLLRRPGFIGIKTGITVTAGPCLASAYQFLGKTYITVLAKCNKPSRRFKQTRKLLKYCLQRTTPAHQLTPEQHLILKKLGKTDEDIDSDYSEEEAEFNFGTFTQEEIDRRARMLTQI